PRKKTDHPAQPLGGLAAALAEGAGRLKALPEQLGDAVGLARPRGGVAEGRPLDRRRPDVEVYPPERHLLLRGLLGQEFLEALVDFALALLDLFHPPG